jgi:hypothetical protein
MRTQFKKSTFAVLVLVAPFVSSCRAIQINQLEKRIDALESRVAAAEAKVEMLARE